MPERALATQPAKEKKEVTPVGFAELKHVLNRVEETYDSIARRAFELFEDSGRTFGHDLEDWFQAEAEVVHPIHINVFESGEALTVQAEVPGFSAKELAVSVEPRRLTITGKREVKAERRTDKTIYSERCADRILRVVELPAEVDTAKVTATLKEACWSSPCPKPRAPRRCVWSPQLLEEEGEKGRAIKAVPAPFPPEGTQKAPRTAQACL